MLPKKELEDKYDIQNKHLDYEGLIHAIRKSWKQEIKKHKMLNLNYLVFTQCNVLCGNSKINIQEVSTK
jgi:oligoribonuclease (3'-5' exoribonuclease)